MPAIVQKRGKQWVVVSHAGKGGRVLGKHKTRAGAVQQQRAVNAQLSKRRR